jgi:hypothetical protein
VSNFEGFRESNTTPVPDILFDELLKELSGSQLKVLLYIIRRTRGFKKDTDAISLTQFQNGITTREGKVLDKGCGIGDRQTIINALESLEAKKCIESVKAKTMSGDNDITRYRIYFAKVGDSHPQEEGGREIQPPANGKNPTTEVVGKSNHQNAKGSREIQPQVVGKSNQGSRANPTRVVGKSNPQETVLQQTGSQQKERETQPPTDSQANASSLSLSLENFSQETKGVAPPSVKGSHSSSTEEIASDPGGVNTNLDTQPPTRSGEKGCVSSRLRIAPQLEPPHNDAPSLPTRPSSVAPNALLERLTEEQSTFWLRFCKVAEVDPSKLNQRAFQHVCALADKALSEEQVKSLYDFEYARLKAAYGEDAIPPRLGNLTNAYRDWKATQRPKEEGLAQGKTGFVPGSGTRLNHTYAKTWKDQPPLDYSYVVPSKPVRSRTVTQHRGGNIEATDFGATLEQFKRRVGVTQ